MVLDCFNQELTVRFDPKGSLVEATGSIISTPADVDVSPKLNVEQAVQKGAEYLAQPHPEDTNRTDQFGEPIKIKAIDLSNFKPVIVSTISNEPSLPTILEEASFP